MKKLFKKSLPILMAGLTFISSFFPVAATVNQKQEIVGVNTGKTEVYYNQESTFGITIPKLIDLGSDKTTDYTVTVSGDISSDQLVLVVPDESFLMKDLITTNNPKPDVAATVTQDKTRWKFNEFGTIGNGKVSAPDLSAGDWEGVFYFNVKLEDCNIEVTAKDAAGNDLNASASYITGTEKEQLIDKLIYSGYISKADDVDALINVDSDSFSGLADTTFNVSDTYKEGDTVAILHYDETKQTWEYIGTETVDENGLISGDFASYSPVAFVKVNSNGIYTHVCNYVNYICTGCKDRVAGLYNANNQLIYNWSQLLSKGLITVSGGVASTSKATSLTGKLYFDKSVKSIKDNGFVGCTKLTEVWFPSSVTSIGRYAFQNSAIVTLNLPCNLSNMSEGAFYGCKSVKNLTIEYGCKTIGYMAFYNGGNSLISVTIPGSVTTIGTAAFKQQGNLKTVIIEHGVKNINGRAFEECGKLTKIIIPTSVVKIGEYAIKSCTSLSQIHYRGTSAQWNAISKGSGYKSSNTSTIIYNYTGN